MKFKLVSQIAVLVFITCCTIKTYAQTPDTTAFRYQYLKFLQRTEIYGIGSARFHAFPGGVHHRELRLTGNDVGIIGDAGFGMQLWLGKFLMNMDFSNFGWQMPSSAPQEAALVRRLGGVRFGYGYTIFESSGFRISPVVAMGGGTMNFGQSQGNPFFYIGGDIEAAYMLTLSMATENRILSGTSLLCSVRIGYGRNIAAALGEESSYDNLNARICIGLGLFSMFGSE